MAGVNWVCLLRIKSSDEDRTHVIEKTTFTIGRTEDADLPLTEPSVSRSHLSVEMRGQQIYVTDLKSGNGTTVNGQKIEPGSAIAITPNDVVKIGMAPHEFRITAIPKPFEMLDFESRNKGLTSSMKDLAVQAERRAKEQYDTMKAKLDEDRIKMKVELEKERALFLKERGNLQSDIAKERAEMIAELDREKASMIDATARERATLQAEAEQEKADARKLFEKERQESRAELDAETTRLAAESASLQAALATEAKNLRDGVTAERAQLLEKFETDEKNLRTEIAHERKSLRESFEGDNKRLREEVAAERATLKTDFERDNKNLRDEVAQERAALTHKYETESKRLHDELEAERTDLKTATENERAIMRSVLMKESDELAERTSRERAEFEKERNEHNSRVDKELGDAKAEAQRLLHVAQKESETLRTQGLIELQAKKQTLETEITQLKQQAAVTASQERLKYAKEADQLIADAQKKIAADYEDAGLQIEKQMQEAQEKMFAIIQDAEKKARQQISEARDEAAEIRSKANDESRAINQEALKKRTATLAQLQEKFQSDMVATREEIIASAKQDAEREQAKFIADTRKEIEGLEGRLNSLKGEVGPMAQRRDKYVQELKDLDDKTSSARRELERNSKEVDNVRAMLARIEEAKRETATAEKALEAVTTRLASERASIDREIEGMRQKALLAFQDEKKGTNDDLAKQRLKALEDVQKRIETEEKRYAETLRFRAIELAQRINAKILPILPELTAEGSDAAGARMKAAIEASTRESLLNEESSFQAPTVDELAPPVPTAESKSKRLRTYAIAATCAIALVFVFFGRNIYDAAKKSDTNSYAAQKMQERHIASIYHPEQDEAFGDGKSYRNNYTDNVLYMKGYYETKLDDLNAKKWLLSLQDLDTLRPKGLDEDDIVRYTTKETVLIKTLAKLKDSVDAQYKDEGLKRMRDEEATAVSEIKAILKTEKNYDWIRTQEKEFLEKVIYR